MTRRLDALNALAATEVMGWDCIHEREVVPRDVLIAEAKVEFRKEYGQEPPAAWVGSVDEDLAWDYPPMWCQKCHYRGQNLKRRLPDYGGSVAAAWPLVEKMQVDGYILSINAGLVDWDAEFYCPHGQCEKHGHTSTVLGHGGQAFNEATAPLAIVIAALRAVGVDEATINEALI